MTDTHDTAAALEAAIDAHGANASGARAALDRAITAHVEAEVARRLAAAPDVEAALDSLSTEHCISTYEFDPLLATIAADKARAVEAAEDAAFLRGRDAVRKYPDGWGLMARPTPDKARRLVEALETAAFEWGMRRNNYERDATATARAALLRALGVEA